MSLPCWRTNVLDTPRCRIVNNLLNFFKGLLSRFRGQEEDVDEHRQVEDTEDNIHFPSDVLESGGKHARARSGLSGD